MLGSSTANYPPYAQVSRDRKQQPYTFRPALHHRLSAFCSNHSPLTDGLLPIGCNQTLRFSRCIDVDLTDTLLHQVSLYLVDFDNAGRSESIEVLNAANNAILINPQTVSQFHGREVLDLEPAGHHVEFLITKVTGPNACVSGLFFSSLPTAVSVSAGGGQSANPNSTFSTALAALVTDAYGNALPGVSVVFTVLSNGSTGSSGTFVGNLTTVTVTTSSNGVAVAPVLTANADAGTFTVTATVVGFPLETTTFTLTIL